MENLNEKSKISDELTKIIVNSFRVTKEKKQEVIEVNTVIYFLLNSYIKGGESKILNELFSGLINTKDPDSDKTEMELLLEVAKKNMEDTFKKDILPEGYRPMKSEPIAASLELDYIFNESEELKKIISSDNSNTIETEYLFLAFLKNSKDNKVTKYLEKFGITDKNLLEKLMSSNLKDKKPEEKSIDWDSPFGGAASFIAGSSEDEDDEEEDEDRYNEDDYKQFQLAGNVGPEDKPLDQKVSETPYLDKYGFDMTKAAREHKYSKIIGRTTELNQLIEILCCKKKNNALIISQYAGSGKTALIELLAQKIVANEVPAELSGKRLVSLNLNSMASGTKWRGSAEERWEEVIKEVVASNKSIIIFIDEFQCLVNNGNSSGSGSGSDILKPYLARGEFQTIGALLSEDYRKFIEPEQALRRRFQNVVIDEPNIENTIKILNGIKSDFMKFHRVKYSPEIIKLCVELSARYITDRYFPDKAIDCLDLSGSLAKLKNSADDSDSDTIKQYRKELLKITEKKINCVRNSEFEEGNKWRNKEIEITNKISELESKMQKSRSNSKNWIDVTEEDVINVVSKISKIPVDQIGKSDTEKIISMKSEMEKHVIGQQTAIDSMSLALQRNILGLRDENKPLAALFFAGASSTGKTLCCKELAREFFGDEKNLIRFDMGEFALSHEVTKLTGATSSYVGYNDEPLLYAVKRKPYSVVLFDEIEKGAQEINSIFLNILSEGYITLGNGTKIDFRNTIVVFTSNLGSSDLENKRNGLGFSKLNSEEKKEDNRSIVLKAIKKHFKPEFINRLSEIIVFNDLGKPEFNQIFDIEFNKVKNRLKKKKINVKVTKNIKEKVVNECNNAREIEKGLIKYVENEICNSIIINKINIKEVSEINVDYDIKNNKVIVSFKNSVKKTPLSKKNEQLKGKTELVEDTVQ